MWIEYYKKRYRLYEVPVTITLHCLTTWKKDNLVMRQSTRMTTTKKHIVRIGHASTCFIHTVDGRNPAPVDMENIPLCKRSYTSQVVQDFFHQQYFSPLRDVSTGGYRSFGRPRVIWEHKPWIWSLPQEQKTLPLGILPNSWFIRILVIGY